MTISAISLHNKNTCQYLLSGGIRCPIIKGNNLRDTIFDQLFLLCLKFVEVVQIGVRGLMALSFWHIHNFGSSSFSSVCFVNNKLHCRKTEIGKTPSNTSCITSEGKDLKTSNHMSWQIVNWKSFYGSINLCFTPMTLTMKPSVESCFRSSIIGFNMTSSQIFIFLKPKGLTISNSSSCKWSLKASGCSLKNTYSLK